MKLHDFTPNLLISHMHSRAPALAAAEKETLDLSSLSRCVRVSSMVTLSQFMLQEFKYCFLLN